MKTFRTARMLMAGVAGLALLAGAARAEDVTVVLPEQPSGLEPCQSIRNNIGRVVNMNLTETLTIVDPATGQVEPHLATAWEQVDDKTWRFTLRDGVAFSDGTPMDAEAVATSIKRLMNPNLTCDSRSKFGDVTLTPTAVEPNVLQVVSSIPNPIMPTLMSTVQIVAPAVPFDAVTNDPIGTGPYTLAEMTNEKIVLARNPDYWGETPAVETATFVWRSESAVRAAMVQSGEADLTPNIAVQDATDPETDFAYLNSETTRMRIDMQYPPLDDVRVREALNIAIDWDGMGEALFGEDVLRASQMVVPGVLGHNADIKPWSYDPERAAQLIEEARADGVPVDTPIVLIGRNGFFPNSGESLEAMQALWSEIGLTIEIRNLEAADWVRYLDKPFPGDRGPTLFQQQHDNNTGDAGFTIPVMYTSNGQYSTVANPELDKIILDAMTRTGAAREQGFAEAARMVHDEIIADVPMYHMIGYSRVNPRLDWVPDLTTNGEIRISGIKFKP
ncbi:ABC transporter substrate-binding protein [Frigidibacter sp. MR17.24]|uniref:ABC transporter substrate-binding protein n=1 Tax=Frigidibacter sp. MR17.24 TaxID=3127345 RepID=UPI0030131335